MKLRSTVAVLLSTVTIAAVSVACSDSLVPETVSLTAAPRHTISDGAHNGTPGFHFLPPLVGQPSVSGSPDGTLAPAIEVCDLGSSVPTFSSPCVLTGVAIFTMTGGTGGESIRYDAGAGHYSANWHTDLSSLQSGHYYRVRISVLGTTLGFADVIPVSGSELRNHRSGDVIALVNGRTLPIKFRVQQGTVGAISSESGGTATLQDGAVTLVFPEGAVENDIAVVATPVTPVPGVTDASVLSGTLYEFQPSPTEFAEPVTLTLTYPATLPTNIKASRLAICKMIDGACRPIAGSRVDPNTRTVTAEISSFSEYGVGEWPEILREFGEAPPGSQPWALSTASGEIRFYLRNDNGSILDWSRDGMYLAMARDSVENPLVNPYPVQSWIEIRTWDGTFVRALARVPLDEGGYSAPIWSPTNDEIAFFHRVGAIPSLMVIDAMGGVPRTLAPANGNATFGPAWSPDGQRIAFTCLWEGVDGICSVHRDGSDLRLLVASMVIDDWTGYESSYLSWSPDGTRLAFSATQRYVGGDTKGLWVVNADGSNLRLLHQGDQSLSTGLPVRPYGAAWSPAGEDIIFQQSDHSGFVRSYIIRSDGTNLRPIIPDALVEGLDYEWHPVWSRDGSRISLWWPTGGGIYVLNADLTGLQLWDNIGYGRTLWRP